MSPPPLIHGRRHPLRRSVVRSAGLQDDMAPAMRLKSPHGGRHGHQLRRDR